jgi:hypothetical protein
VRDGGTHALQVKALLLGVAEELAVGVDLPARRDQERAELDDAVMAAVVACCAVPLLVLAGVLSSAGLLLNNPVVVALGVGALAWAGLRTARAVRARGRADDQHETTPR